MTALVVLRDKVVQPLLASSCQRKRGRKPKNVTPLETQYEHLQAGMRELFAELGIAGIGEAAKDQQSFCDLLR
jgi:hypothetical protein